MFSRSRVTQKPLFHPVGCNGGFTEIDSDLDGVADCLDQCPSDATKTLLGSCGCGCHGGKTVDCVELRCFCQAAPCSDLTEQKKYTPGIGPALRSTVSRQSSRRVSRALTETNRAVFMQENAVFYSVEKRKTATKEMRLLLVFCTHIYRVFCLKCPEC